MRRKHKNLIYTSQTLRGSKHYSRYPYCRICKGICREENSDEYICTGMDKPLYGGYQKGKEKRYCQHHAVTNRTLYTGKRRGLACYSPLYYISQTILAHRIEIRDHIKEAIEIYSDFKEFRTGLLSKL